MIKKIMLLTEPKKEIWKEYLNDKNYIAEFKRDGNRLFFKYDSGIFKFISRKGEVYTKPVPKKIIATANLFKENNYMKSCLLDGELVYVDKNGNDHRTQAQCPEAYPFYIVFDILELNGEDLTEQPWVVRKHELLSLFQEYDMQPISGKHIIFMQHYTDKKETLKVAKEKKMEGIVLKNINSKYINGKSKECVKIKFKETDEYIVVGYIESGKTKTGVREKYFGSLLLAQYDKDGKLKSKARIGGGFKEHNLIEVTKLLNKNKSLHINSMENLTNKDYNIPKGKIYWLNKNDRFIIEVKMSGKTEYNNPYQPQFVTIRTDKYIKDVIEK